MEAAVKLFNRLSEVEKIALRAASSATIEYLSDTYYRGDLYAISASECRLVLSEAQALCNLQFAAKSKDLGFNGVTWKF